MPAHKRFFAKEWQAKAESCDRRAAKRATDVKEPYDKHARPLPKLVIGTHVRVQHPTTKRWDTICVVMGIGQSRDYLI